MQCPNCHAYIEEHSLFCCNCGRSIPEPPHQQYNGYNGQYNQQHNPNFRNPVDARLAELGSVSLTLAIIGIILFFAELWYVTVILNVIAWSKIRQARAINNGSKHFYISSLNSATVICNIINWLFGAVIGLFLLRFIL